MQVSFKYKNGAERMMARRYADILQKLGRGTYMTRDMQAERKPNKTGAADVTEPKETKKKSTQSKKGFK